ncbi:helix-turn-helix transcriptional regulator [Streptomyces sp. TLI_185]|uniref:helix-turn-helix domain-containing protein n=1 Tax=Streptomyces sp. TLI_185 TaxID=2485151 RepID=UPI0021A58EA6|nr:helix-turn-helix transcriptional regulator [Streptomyces sp. TLI_185]
MKEFYGAELRRRREDAGFSQSGLGELLFCSGSYIGQMEVATRSPQLDMSEQIDTILKTTGSSGGSARPSSRRPRPSSPRILRPLPSWSSGL